MIAELRTSRILRLRRLDLRRPCRRVGLGQDHRPVQVRLAGEVGVVEHVVEEPDVRELLDDVGARRRRARRGRRRTARSRPARPRRGMTAGRIVRSSSRSPLDDLHWVADHRDPTRLDWLAGPGQPDLRHALVVAQEEEAVRLGWSHSLEAGDEAGQFLPVQPAEVGPAGPLVRVDVEDALATIKHLLHGTADRLAVDSGARERVVDVTVVSQRAVGRHQDEGVVSPDVSQPAEQEADPLGGERVRTREVGPHLLVEPPCNSDSDIHFRCLR